jgi:hypothetical protein
LTFRLYDVAEFISLGSLSLLIAYKILVGTPDGRDHLGDLGVADQQTDPGSA